MSEKKVALVAGAGASYGAFLDDNRAHTRIVKNPPTALAPLTTGLVERLDDTSTIEGDSRVVLDMLLNAQVARGPEFDFESSLADVWENVALSTADREIAFHRLRFAIYELFYAVSNVSQNARSNYDFLISRLKGSPSVSDSLFVLTPNYDLLIERALARAGWDKRHAIVQHPHGAIDRTLRDTSSVVSPHLGWNDYKTGFEEQMRSNATQATWELGDKFASPPAVSNWPTEAAMISPKYSVNPRVHYHIPGIELPIAGKHDRDFVRHLWSEEEKVLARDHLASSTHLLVIGWRAADGEIADLVKSSISYDTVIHIASGDDAAKVAHALGTRRAQAFQFFSDYVRSEEFDALL